MFVAQSSTVIKAFGWNHCNTAVGSWTLPVGWEPAEIVVHTCHCAWLKDLIFLANFSPKCHQIAPFCILGETKFQGGMPPDPPSAVGWRRFASSLCSYFTFSKCGRSECRLITPAGWDKLYSVFTAVSLCLYLYGAGTKTTMFNMYMKWGVTVQKKRCILKIFDKECCYC